MKHNSNNQINIYRRQNFLADSQTIPKTLEDLNLMDSFLLDATTEDPENAKTIAKVAIKRATGHDIENLIVETQKQFKGISLDKRGIRLDIYARENDPNEEGGATLRLYDIEPNKYHEENIPYRSRFYQSLIDSKLLPTDTPFKKLPELITIWILPYDPFDDDRMVYTVKNVVEENNHLVYNDGVTKLFLYTKGTKGGSKELKNFLTYMENTTLSNAVDEDLLRIQKIVDTVKSRKDVGEQYMTLQEMINYEKRDSLALGKLIGAISNCKFLNLDIVQTKTTIMKQFNLPENLAEEYLKLYW